MPTYWCHTAISKWPNSRSATEKANNNLLSARWAIKFVSIRLECDGVCSPVRPNDIGVVEVVDVVAKRLTTGNWNMSGFDNRAEWPRPTNGNRQSSLHLPPCFVQVTKDCGEEHCIWRLANWQQDELFVQKLLVKCLCSKNGWPLTRVTLAYRSSSCFNCFRG